MRTVDLIVKKKDGFELSTEEIHFLIDGYVKNIVTDYQMSAFLMAICINGTTIGEQVALTKEILESGEQVDLSEIDGLCVDKHSTGGVGDKTTLVVGPILAALGLNLAKMSGRGLGHTGGTLDKLESIPGFKISISSKDFINQVKKIGLAVVGQTLNITPADKKLYALRDVTGTVNSVGLIASSIMSKKLASGAHSILLDVKVGEGAFMKTLEEAKVLAKAMVEIGKSYGRDVVAMLTNMEEPLGEAVGNSIEVIEAIDTLKGRGPKNFTKLCEEICAEMLIVTNQVINKEEALIKIKEVINNKQALNKFKEMIAFQGGDVRVIDDYSIFPQAKNIIKVYANNPGYIKKIDAYLVGVAASKLGAGRNKKEDNIDPAVGIKVIAKVGDKINKDDLLAIIYANDLGIDEVKNDVLNAFTITKEKQNHLEMILGIVN
ncbi:MAG: thymidine phosphorylase [Bacilli bacterium]|nr:thymidine phosphorylase [Bacilli bacterium]MDY0364144.1 thymidine phosphorylase [Bacilli bacterium]